MCSENGKPYVADLGLSSSHSQDTVALAFSTGFAVGIDLEVVQRSFEFESVVLDHFSRGEQRILGAIPEHERQDAFYRCWTAKEACAKAYGVGIGLSLNRFEVTEWSEYGSDHIRTDGKPDARISMERLIVGDRLAATLALLMDPNQPKRPEM